LEKKYANVGKQSRGRFIIPGNVEFGRCKEVKVNVSGNCKELSDSVTKVVAVAPRGFPVNKFASGYIQGDKGISFVVNIPKNAIKGSEECTVTIVTSILSNLSDSFQSLISCPGGCFEQVSSTLYPLIMAQKYFQVKQTPIPESLKNTINSHLSIGYAKIKGYEISGGGFDWYGSAPANESLSAYGILQLNDMKSVFPVEQDLIDRASKWLSTRKDGKGGFNRGNGRYGFGNAPYEITNTWICWAVTEAGHPYSSVSVEVDKAIQKASDEFNPYVVALAAMTAFHSNLKNAGKSACDRLVQFQSENGSVLNSDPNNSRSSSFTTVTYSYGDDYVICCTSLSIMAWLRGGASYIDKVTSAVKWLATKCSYGRFGSTHSTILALKAIVEYEAFLNTGTASLSSLKILFDEEPNPVKIEDSKIVTNLTSKIKFGKKHKVQLSHKEKNPIFFAASIKYYQEQPDNHPNCCLTLKN